MYTPGILLARVKRLRSKFFRALRGAFRTQVRHCEARQRRSSPDRSALYGSLV